MGLIEDHLSKYPLMDISDKIKLLMQSIMGPGHLVNDREKVKENLIKEYMLCKDLCYNYELIEDIGSDFARVYIKPYYEEKKSFDKLIEAFMLSSNEYTDIHLLEVALLKLRETQSDLEKKVIDKYLTSGSILISHSQIYKENYHPHYLVISKKYLSYIN